MTLFEDVLSMVEALQAEARYGPYFLYLNPRMLGFTNDRRIARRWSRRRRRKMIVYKLKPRIYEVPR